MVTGIGDGQGQDAGGVENTTLFPFFGSTKTGVGRKSASGKKLEKQVALCLEDSGWAVSSQYIAGYRLGKTSRHKVDLYAAKSRKDILISCKYQDVPGTASDKLFYEYACLLKAVEECLIDRAFMVLFGEHLKQANMFASQEVGKYLRLSPKVCVCDFEVFTKMVNRDTLLDGVNEKQSSLW